MYRRLVFLYAGLWLYGQSLAMMVRGALGLSPWDVFHQGMTRHLPISLGAAVAITGVLVLLAWIPLRERPGLGTISNVVVIAFAVDVTLYLLPEPGSLPVRVGLLAGGVLLNAVATVCYVGARFGPGPRDGLMTGLARRTGAPVWLVRTGIETTVVAGGWLLGGSFGIGTALYALAIGPLIQLCVPLVERLLPGTADAFTAHSTRTAGPVRRSPVRPSGMPSGRVESSTGCNDSESGPAATKSAVPAAWKRSSQPGAIRTCIDPPAESSSSGSPVVSNTGGTPGSAGNARRRAASRAR